MGGLAVPLRTARQSADDADPLLHRAYESCGGRRNSAPPWLSMSRAHTYLPNKSCRPRSYRGSITSTRSCSFPKVAREPSPKRRDNAAEAERAVELGAGGGAFCSGGRGAASGEALRTCIRGRGAVAKGATVAHIRCCSRHVCQCARASANCSGRSTGGQRCPRTRFKLHLPAQVLGSDGLVRLRP